jgi:hypothetical protein
LILNTVEQTLTKGTYSFVRIIRAPIDGYVTALLSPFIEGGAKL